MYKGLFIVIAVSLTVCSTMLAQKVEPYYTLVGNLSGVAMDTLVRAEFIAVDKE